MIISKLPSFSEVFYNIQIFFFYIYDFDHFIVISFINTIMITIPSILETILRHSR